MLPAAINPGNYLKVPYQFFSAVTPLHVRVFSNVPVSTYVVDDVGLLEYQTGGSVQSFGGVMNQTTHNFSTVLPYRPRWWLIILNLNAVAAYVQYEVSLAGPVGPGPSGASGLGDGYGVPTGSYGPYRLSSLCREDVWQVAVETSPRRGFFRPGAQELPRSL